MSTKKYIIGNFKMTASSETMIEFLLVQEICNICKYVSKSVNRKVAKKHDGTNLLSDLKKVIKEKI